MKPSNLDLVLDLLAKYDCEIVSFGLAPNPSGFCFEVGDDTTKEQALEITKALDALTSKEELELKKRVF